jgi:hypothetical protein
MSCSCQYLVTEGCSRFTKKERSHTRVPNDHISIAVFQGNLNMISRLDHIGVPNVVPNVAYSESTVQRPPKSPSWTSENHMSPS